MLLINTLCPSGEAVKAKNEKHLTRARACAHEERGKDRSNRRACGARRRTTRAIAATIELWQYRSGLSISFLGRLAEFVGNLDHGVGGQ